MKLAVFELSMPSANIWNSRWSREEEYHALVREIPEELKLGAYRYSFGDGWIAQVAVREVDSRTAKKIKKDSSGFCGYEWMVDSILEHGEIKI